MEKKGRERMDVRPPKHFERVTQCAPCGQPLYYNRQSEGCHQVGQALLRTPVLYHADGSVGCGTAEIDLAMRIVEQVRDHGLTLFFSSWSLCGDDHEWLGFVKEVGGGGFTIAGTYRRTSHIRVTFDPYSRPLTGSLPVDAMAIINGTRDEAMGFFRVATDPFEDCPRCQFEVLKRLIHSGCVIYEQDGDIVRYTLVPHKHASFFPEKTEICPACMRSKKDPADHVRVFCAACELIPAFLQPVAEEPKRSFQWTRLRPAESATIKPHVYTAKINKIKELAKERKIGCAFLDVDQLFNPKICFSCGRPPKNGTLKKTLPFCNDCRGVPSKAGDLLRVPL